MRVVTKAFTLPGEPWMRRDTFIHNALHVVFNAVVGIGISSILVKKLLALKSQHYVISTIPADCGIILESGTKYEKPTATQNEIYCGRCHNDRFLVSVYKKTVLFKIKSVI